MMIQRLWRSARRIQNKDKIFVFRLLEAHRANLLDEWVDREAWRAIRDLRLAYAQSQLRYAAHLVCLSLIAGATRGAAKIVQKFKS